MAALLWSGALVTYAVAAATPAFRTMVVAVLGGPGATLGASIFVALANAAILAVILHPIWDEPLADIFGVYIAFLGHLVCALLWVPIVLLHVRGTDYEEVPNGRPRFPMGHFCCQRVVLVGAWITATITAYHTYTHLNDSQWDTIVCWLCAVWVLVTFFDAFIWDILYAKELLKDPNGP